MDRALGILREKYPQDWLFALGCFHPSRLDKFKKLNVWGDYKGWIFQYEKRNETLKEQLEVFASNHLKHVDHKDNQEAVDLIPTLQTKVALQKNKVTEQRKQSHHLFKILPTLKPAYT